ncbi:inhibitor of growth protein 3 [Rhagoletis pomonella]|uniref:inhibitor of growth protein 3 n=1 Tax=Rhagoletis pomonella TaxID=28610 RepID=UPI00177E0A68|nr:inhibitor of growth protein 3 [Rhagoletis pomonella]
MLYLEDYLEMIEHLPQELRDRFTEMRELDLTVQNSMDSLEKKTRTFFQQCKRGELQNETADSDFQNLRKEYYKVLEDADEKVNIATQIHELVERYLRRLDSELFKFKCELEADNNGITEILEKRSLELDGGSSAATALINVIGVTQKENRYYGSIGVPATTNSHSILSVPGATMGGLSLPATPLATPKDNRYRTPKPEKRRDSTTNISGIPEKRPNINNTITSANPSVAVVRPITPGIGTHAVLNSATTAVTAAGNPSAVTYNLQQLGGSASSAIAAAASQAIVATQQMPQGRRTASLKASYEAIHGAGGGPPEFWISRDIANAATAAAQTVLPTPSLEKKQKKKINTSSITHANTTISGSAPSSAISLASSSSSVSVDSVDMLPSSSNLSTVGNLSVTSIGLTAIGGGGASTSAAAANRASSVSSSISSTTLAPTSNITINENGLVVEQTPEGEWSYDPNEPRYCTCNQVSYGDMVACDNDACPYEWFHYPCVGITQPPKGKWYCPKCTASMRRRGNRKN